MGPDGPDPGSIKTLMSTLRKRLEDLDPSLHGSLERSWKIALGEWLPAVPPQSDSFNSYPHIRNIETHLDQLFSACEPLPVSREAIRLRPVEIYVLLTSVLLHDFGRTRNGSDHAKRSWETIQSRSAEIGIPSPELARVVANVCLAHDPPLGWPKSSLYDVVIEPYGEIRQRPLAALLTLTDHMDGAHTRVVPAYVKDVREFDTLGMFRSAVRGVHADCSAQAVKVVLADMAGNKDGRKTLGREAVEYSIFCADDKDKHAISRAFQLQDDTLIEKWAKQLKSANRIVKQTERERKMAGILVRAAVDIADHIREHFSANCNAPSILWEWLTPIDAACSLIEHQLRGNGDAFGVPDDAKDRLGLANWLVVLGLFRAKLERPPSRVEDREWWPLRSMLAALMGDVRANTVCLRDIRCDLATIGIPLAAWLIEHREHLYTFMGYETYEPIFDKAFLSRVADGMWDLSSSVFACERFTYDELASQVWETDVDKVRRAVRRISVITRNRLRRPGCPDLIWAGAHDWRWQHRVYPVCSVDNIVNLDDCSELPISIATQLKQIRCECANRSALTERDDYARKEVERVNRAVFDSGLPDAAEWSRTDSGRMSGKKLLTEAIKGLHQPI